MKNLLRQLLPFGIVESHRRRYWQNHFGITRGTYTSREIEDALQACRFELWPPELRRAPHDWVFVDVGANVGDYLAAVLKLVSPKKVIAIEPLPSCHARLTAVLAKSRNSELVKAAAGEINAEIALHCTGDSKMSSVLQPLDEISTAYQPGDYTTRETLNVPMVCIDDVVPSDSSVGLLKLDVQGFEIAALRGSEATLQRTRAVQVEINYAPHYEGAASFDEVHEFLVARDFQLFGVSAPYFGNGRPLWADAIYTRIG